ncbi:MAG: hypothetical protein ACI4HQ_01510 [Acetatifactor sp.]
MADYDASVRVHTEVDSSQMQKMQIQIDKATAKVSDLSNKLGELKNKKVATKEYQEISDQITRAEARLISLTSRQQKMIELGKNSGAAWDSLKYDIEEVKNEIECAKYDMEDLVEKGKAFKIGGDENEIAGLEGKLKIAEAELSALNTKQQEMVDKQSGGTAGFHKLASSANRCFKTIQSGAKKSNGLLSTMKSRLKGIALSLLVFSWITKGFNAMVAAMKEGFRNLAQYSSDYNNSMSALKSQTAQLKNNLAAAFEPIANIVIPYLSQLVAWLNRAVESVAQFLAALQGKSTYTKAKKQVIDYAKSLDTASKSAKGALASFDKLNVLNKNTPSAGAGGELTGAYAFETGEVSSEISGFASDILKAIKPFKEALSGWWNKVDFEPLLKSFGRLKEACEPFMGYLYDGLLWFLENILLPLGSWVIEDAVPAFFDLLSAALEVLSTIIDELRPYGEWLWNNLLQPLAEWTGDTVIEGMQFLTQKLQDFSNWCKSDKENVETMSDVVLGLLAGIVTYYTIKKIPTAIETISNALKNFGGIAKALISPVGLAAMAIGVLVTSILLISRNWNKLDIIQKGIAIFSGLVAAAIAAAAAMAIFHTCWSVGVAAAAIITGLAAIGFTSAILAKQNVTSTDGSAGTSFYNSHIFSASPLPQLADGAVIQGGRPFAAILGDQKFGQTNIETPLKTMIEAFEIALDKRGGAGGGEYTFVAQLEGETIFRETVRQDQLYQNRTGHSAFDQ